MLDPRIESYELIRKSHQKYGFFHKCLFHIHTPASYDYCLYEEYRNTDYYKKLSIDDIFEIAIGEGLFKPEFYESHDDFQCDIVFKDKKEHITFLLIAQKLFQNKIELAVIADHNTITGFSKLKKAIALYYETYKPSIYPHLLLGVEISCADKNHVVGIFDPKKKGIEISLSNWLGQNIMSEKDGTYRTCYDILSDIQKSPLNGIGYIAHIDTSDTFKDRFFTKTYKKQLFSSRHLAIGLSDIQEIPTVTRNIKKYNHGETAYIWDNDSHSIDTINSKFFWIKGQSINFNMLKNALRDYEIAIHYSEPREPNQFILGLAIESGEENFLRSNTNEQIFHTQFSDSLNCFIGGRGTGKSTVLNILNFVLGQYLPQEYDKGKNILTFVCRHPLIYVFYRFEGMDYVVTFSSPQKEFADDNILRYFISPTPFNQEYRHKYQYNRAEIAEYAVKNYIEIHRLRETSTGIKLEKILEKRPLLNKFFVEGYSVNDLVNIAGSASLGEYIYSVLFKNEVLSVLPTRSIRSQKGLLSWIGDMESHLEARTQEVYAIISAYNETQKNSLKITYLQNSSPDIRLPFDDLLQGQIRQWYKNNKLHIVEYLYALYSCLGLAQMLNLFLAGQYLDINNALSISSYFEEEDKNLTDDDTDALFEKIKNDIFSIANISLWVKCINNWISKLESFGLEFNINNREQSAHAEPIYKPIGELSLGQKVVAMLSFILSYSEYAQDFTPLIIDQPEDNLDNQYIHKNLVNDLRRMKGRRQVIIATHSSTIVTNAKAEQVVVMDSDNVHGWISETGYPTDPTIIKHIINHLEGGVASFNHKAFIYDDILSKLS